MTLSFREAVDQLADASSPRRRAAAKRLRKLQDPAAVPALLAALRREVEKRRTWETQYQMIMALGMCGDDRALPFLKDLAVSRKPAYAATYAALGNAIVRLGRSSDRDTSPIFWCLELDDDHLTDGAFRAMAMLRMVPDDDDISRILRFVEQRDPIDMLRVWPAAAAAGWPREIVHDFLLRCAESGRRDLEEVAKLSISREYRDYQTL
ncbi:HEAT repeat domain-containing protein [Nonomuraea sp. NN258]|uniref:HEAT repeat domain-containing protein n=1 Tax=Nonomuraea antri TaxID=2730852 RepID=UPI00156A4594|nr:HEAT repeat domain-containing protein [Nonomuraea antri]NRQ33713.1 HEAT repeat domain-containing protein [Nonomuraea antri]